MNKRPLFLLALVLPLSAQANVYYIKADTVKNTSVNEAAIYFNGAINNRTVTWLLSSLAEIAGRYRNIKNIDIYLNSEGGDMDAGYEAYEALRKSAIKLNMIDASVIASAATMIYCGSDERYAMPLARFMLHPAAAWNDKADYLKPDQARRILEDAESYNVLFRTIYSTCTKISADELNKITASETGRVFYKVDEAAKAGLVTRGIKESHSYSVTYYVTDGDS